MTKPHSPTSGPLASGSVVVLLSGGLDSAACASFYHSRRYEATALFVEYGQGALEQERRAARRIADHYGIRLSVVQISGLGPFSDGFIPGRNALLATAALSHVHARSTLVALGIHAGTSYADCSQAFVDAMQRLFDIYTGGRVRMACPFLEWTKAQLGVFCREAEVPVGMTYSCEAGGDPPCGVCLSCKDREALRELR